MKLVDEWIFYKKKALITTAVEKEDGSGYELGVWSYGEGCQNSNIGVRPAMWLNISELSD